VPKGKIGIRLPGIRCKRIHKSIQVCLCFTFIEKVVLSLGCVAGSPNKDLPSNRNNPSCRWVLVIINHPSCRWVLVINHGPGPFIWILMKIGMTPENVVHNATTKFFSQWWRVFSHDSRSVHGRRRQKEEFNGSGSLAIAEEG
jgi:hypothetical protein